MLAQVAKHNSHIGAFFMDFSVFCQFVTMTMVAADQPPYSFCKWIQDSYLLLSDSATVRQLPH